MSGMMKDYCLKFQFLPRHLNRTLQTFFNMWKIQPSPEANSIVKGGKRIWDDPRKWIPGLSWRVVCGTPAMTKAYVFRNRAGDLTGIMWGTMWGNSPEKAKTGPCVGNS